MSEVSVPLPDDGLSSGLYRHHPLFADDLDTLISYAEQVLDRYELPTPAHPGLVDRDASGVVRWRRLGSRELEGAGSTSILVGELLSAWVEQERVKDRDAWEVAYAYSLNDLVSQLRNEVAYSVHTLESEKAAWRSGMPGTPASATKAGALVLVDQGRRLGDLLARWRLFWRHGTVIAGDVPRRLEVLLWRIIEAEEEAETPRASHVLATALEDERLAGTPLGMELREAHAPSADRVGRVIARLRAARKLGRVGL